MLSGRMVQLIESHAEQLTDDVVQAIRSNPDLPTLSRRPDIELREWCREILDNLGYLLSGKKDDEVRRRYQIMGRLRFEESIPLQEAVLRIYILKDRILDFSRQQAVPLNSLQIYAEEELERSVCRFFDALVYHMVRGYEDARRRADRLTGALR